MYSLNEASYRAPGLDEFISQAADLMAQERFEEAVSAWSAIIGMNAPDMPSGVYARLADAYKRLGQVDRVVETCEAAQSRKVWDYSLFAVTVRTLTVAEKPDSALSIARTAARTARSPEDKRQALELVAWVENEAGNRAKSIEILSDLIDTLEEMPSAKAETALRGQLDRLLERQASADAWEDYWRSRQDYVYMHVIRRLMEMVGRSARVVADIGSNRTPILDFYLGPRTRYSVDIDNPYRGEGVISVKQDFYIWAPPEPVDVVTCFQVIEHVPDPGKFVRRLLEYGEIVIFSVPYLEPAGINPGHINNDIDYDMIVEWAGRAPNYHYIARELSGDERIICFFDTLTEAKYERMDKASQEAMNLKYRWGRENEPVEVKKPSGFLGLFFKR